MYNSRILIKNIFAWGAKNPCAKQHVLNKQGTLLATRTDFYKCQNLHSLFLTTPACGFNSCRRTILNKSIQKPTLSITTMTIRLKHENPYPDLDEDDLDEMFVRGSGPGGQAVNKTTNCVLLKHKPTGVHVKCHETRSLDTNRKRARVRLQEKLDWHFNKEDSLKETEKRQASKRHQDKKKKTHLKLEKLRAFKEELKKEKI